MSPVAVPADDWLEDTSFRNICLFYRAELTKIYETGRPPRRDSNFTIRRAKILQQRGIITKVKQPARTSPAYRYFLTPAAIAILGLEEAPP